MIDLSWLRSFPFFLRTSVLVYDQGIVKLVTTDISLQVIRNMVGRMRMTTGVRFLTEMWRGTGNELRQILYINTKSLSVMKHSSQLYDS